MFSVVLFQRLKLQVQFQARKLKLSALSMQQATDTIGLDTVHWQGPYWLPMRASMCTLSPPDRLTWCVVISHDSCSDHTKLSIHF